jgi:hypothetical protein
MMTVVLFVASLLKCLIICFSHASLVGSSSSSCCARQAGSTWHYTHGLSSQIGGYRLGSGCLKSFTKDSTRSSSSSFGQFGLSMKWPCFRQESKQVQRLIVDIRDEAKQWVGVGFSALSVLLQ